MQGIEYRIAALGPARGKLNLFREVVGRQVGSETLNFAVWQGDDDGSDISAFIKAAHRVNQQWRACKFKKLFWNRPAQTLAGTGGGNDRDIHKKQKREKQKGRKLPFALGVIYSIAEAGAGTGVCRVGFSRVSRGSRNAASRGSRKFVSREDVVPGIENFPDALNKLFSGENFGKLVLKVADG